VAISGISLDDVPGVVVLDTSATATVVRNAAGVPVELWVVAVNNASPLGACYLQLHDSRNPSLGTDWAKHCIMVPADSRIVVSIVGDNGLEFATALSYAFTDAAKGSSLTGTGRTLWTHAE